MVSNSKILVAGGSGFIGKNLINDLISKGNEVISISKNINSLNQIEKVKYIYHDLTIPLEKEKINSLSGLEYIINCSGYVDHKSFENGGIKIFQQHFNSLYLLANLGISLGIKTFIQIGSSDEYGEKKGPIDEEMRESPISPYSLAKLTATHYLINCFKKGLLNTVVLRPFLVFGEMQSKNRFLPYLIDNCIKNKEFNVTKGEQKRDYLYIKDFNRALLKSLTTESAYGEILNIASGQPRTIKKVIGNVKQIIGKGKPVLGGLKYREGESMELYANIEKAKRILNWEPKYEFKDSLQKVINWYLEYG